MPAIFANILSLVQHITTLKQEPDRYKPSYCACCGMAKPWWHGYYLRKADRTTGALNPILIPRFFCRHCRKTFSVLPECIPPRRWYLWCVQQLAILHYCLGGSLRASSASSGPSRSTCRRWLQRLTDQFSIHRSVLLERFPALGRCAETLQTFWQAVCGEISFAKAMCFCHQANVSIP